MNAYPMDIDSSPEPDDYDDPSDIDWAPEARSHFNSVMRWTAEPHLIMGVRKTTHAKPITFQIKAGSKDKRKPYEMMGRHPASTYMDVECEGRQGKIKSAEWCHIQAACLGGLTIKENLMVGSFACNSEMFVIENLLQGKTHLCATVIVKYNLPDTPLVAEFIDYFVFDPRNRSQDWQHTIDGQSDCFDWDDADRLRADLKEWLKSHRFPKGYR